MADPNFITDLIAGKAAAKTNLARLKERAQQQDHANEITSELSNTYKEIASRGANAPEIFDQLLQHTPLDKALYTNIYGALIQLAIFGNKNALNVIEARAQGAPLQEIEKEAPKLVYPTLRNMATQGVGNAFEMLREQAEGPSATGEHMFRVAEICQTRHNHPMTAYWYEKALYAGHEQAKKRVQEKAQEGDGGAQHAMGVYHQVQEDYTQACAFFEQSANAGNQHGMYKLAVLYQKRHAPHINYENKEQAAEAMERADKLMIASADLGNPSAQCYAGNIYSKTQNKEKALQYFTRAAEQFDTPTVQKLDKYWKEKLLYSAKEIKHFAQEKVPGAEGTVAYFCALTQEKKQNWEGAETLLQRAKEQGYNNTNVTKHMVYVLIKQNKTEDAVPLIFNLIQNEQALGPLERQLAQYCLESVPPQRESAHILNAIRSIKEQTQTGQNIGPVSALEQHTHKLVSRVLSNKHNVSENAVPEVVLAYLKSEMPSIKKQLMQGESPETQKQIEEKTTRIEQYIAKHDKLYKPKSLEITAGEGAFKNIIERQKRLHENADNTTKQLAQSGKNVWQALELSKRQRHEPGAHHAI